MKTFLISDNVDTRTGLRLVGIDGCVVHEKEEVEKALANALEDKELSFLLITEELAKLCGEIIDEIKLSHSLPLVVVIPDRHGTKRPKDFISAYVRDAIGVKI